MKQRATEAASAVGSGLSRGVSGGVGTTSTGAANLIEVNGDVRPLQPATHVQGLLAELGLAGKRVAVAVNRSVVPRSRYQETFVSPGDRIEILEAVGGG